MHKSMTQFIVMFFESNKLVTIYDDFALKDDVTCNKREDNYVNKLQLD